MKKITVFALAAFLIPAAIFAGGSKEKTTIVMGTNAAFPPFEYIGGASGNDVVGFDVEIAKAIAAKAGKTLKIEDMEFDSLLTALQADKIDMAIAGMTITEKRKESVDFSSPYYEATQAVILKADNASIAVLDDLKEKKIAVQLGTTGNEVAKKYTKDESIVAFNTGFEAVMELKNGKVDCVIIDEQPAQNFVKKNPDLKVVKMAFDPEFYGIAVKKGNAQLLATINATLAELKSSGAYDAIVSEYIK